MNTTVRNIQVPEDVINVLAGGYYEGNLLKLPGKLDRALYTATNKVLEALGGKWNRKAGGHVFDGDAEELVEQVIQTGTYSRTKQDFGAFDTPESLAESIADRADIQEGMKVYEPSAGVGRLVRAAVKRGAVVFANEMQPERHAVLVRDFYSQFGAGGCGLGDFLEVAPNPVFDRVLMNPPFSKAQDIKHIQHAFEFLKPGGRLVAIASASVNFRDDQAHRIFRAWVIAYGGTIEDLPDGSFKESGTMVKTVMVTMDAP